MPVIIQYVVERDGIEKMTFISKADAEAYDKLLNTASMLYSILDQSDLAGDQDQKEALSMYLAENKDALLEALGSKRKASSKSKKANTSEVDTAIQLDLADAAPKKSLEDLVIEPDEEAIYEEEEPVVQLDQDESDDFMESNVA